MERFSILEGGFFAFIMAKRRPAAFAWLVVTSAVLLTVMFGGMMWVAFRLVEAAINSGADIFAAQFALFPLILLGSLLIVLVFYAGWWRFLTGRKLPALIPFRIGADEGRQFVTMMVHTALLIGLYILLSIPLMFVMFSLVDAEAGTGVHAFPITGFLISMAVFYGLIFVICLVFAVKLMPAYAMSIIERRIVVFDAWKASAGVFWKAIAATLIPMSVFLVLEAVYLWQIWWPQMLALQAGELPEPSPMLRILTDPAAVIGLIVAGLFAYVILVAFMLGPFAYIAVRHSGWASGEPPVRDEPLAPLRPLSTTQTTS